MYKVAWSSGWLALSINIKLALSINIKEAIEPEIEIEIEPEPEPEPEPAIVMSHTRWMRGAVAHVTQRDYQLRPGLGFSIPVYTTPGFYMC